MKLAKDFKRTEEQKADQKLKLKRDDWTDDD